MVRLYQQTVNRAKIRLKTQLERVSVVDRVERVRDEVELARKQRILDREKRSTRKDNSDDPEKHEKLQDILARLHEQILLEDHAQPLDLESVLVKALEPSQVEYFQKNKNKDFYRCKTVFDAYSDNPIQIKLNRDGYLKKTSIKKKMTLNQYVKVFIKAIDDKLKSEREKILIEKVKQLEFEVLVYKSNLDKNFTPKQQYLNALATADALGLKIKNQDIADLFGVSVKTITDWKRELNQ